MRIVSRCRGSAGWVQQRSNAIWCCCSASLLQGHDWHLQISQGLRCSDWAAAATLKNLCSSSCAAVGRRAGSLTRHLATMSRMALEKCFFASLSSDGGGFWMVISSTCRR